MKKKSKCAKGLISLVKKELKDKGFSHEIVVRLRLKNSKERSFLLGN